MTTLREAAALALEALEQIRTPLRINTALDAYDVSRAIAALRTALAEPETEAETYKRLYELRGKALERPCFHCGYKPKKIYPMEQRTEPEQEVVHQWRKRDCADWYDGHPDHEDGGGPYETRTLYTHPPQRKPLTDEEVIEHFQTQVDTGSLLSFTDGVRYAERAHGIGGAA